MTRDLMWWATGCICWALVGVGVVTTLGGGYTLGGGSTLGDCYTLGVVSTLWGVVCLGVGSTLGDWVGRGVSEVTAGFRAPKRSRSLSMASSWLWCAVSRESLMAHEINLREWEIRSLGVSVV